MTQLSETPVTHSRSAKADPEIKNAIRHEAAVTIKATAAELFAYWRDFNNLSRFMKQLTAVKVRSDRLSHWKWGALKGAVQVEWDSEVTDETPGSRICWRSLEGSTVAHAGEVNFRDLSEGRGAEVRVTLDYHPPGGKVTDFIAKVLGESPRLALSGDLQRLRQLVETGVIPTTDGQSRGGETETTKEKS